ncbi:GNAT family N-acetyltransferase [Leadbettera azotonutricia]|uniref:Acetyltransferase, GNAT family n=1 Tax=Leadbettera azotonutricia (strain ATCC BAA-888 / DSM 13862 / ZAS-9) TaxID=545695 RepID=F5YGE0_LEAAZ|nr:GNAT family N-acetyltransferase [Leadbettera azotonutricia]AEF82079.1 acetyltransferase, GNAT family [Leadbettera azotonutricia ZAS-9]
MDKNQQKQVWKKLPRKMYSEAQEFLEDREDQCVSACARFLHMKGSRDHVWALRNGTGSIKALLLHSRRSLYPILNGNHDIALPKFLNNFLLKVPIHAVQGLKPDAEILEAAMESKGYHPAERIDYDLMALEDPPVSSCFRSGPVNLALRPPMPGDIEELFQLQAAYEQEEVLPKGAVFYPAASRANLERLLRNEQMLLACLDGRIVGKINTSAASFTRYQIGGVYVRPDYRGRGIAVRMAAVFLKGLINEGRGVTLFVKKQNAAARAVYRHTGFTVQGDYRICYY